MQRYVAFAYPGTIRRVQRKAIAIDKHYIMLLEHAKKNLTAIQPSEIVLPKEDPMALDDDNDLGTVVDTQEPFTEPQHTHDGEHAKSEEALPQDVSSTTTLLLERSRTSIMDIS